MADSIIVIFFEESIIVIFAESIIGFLKPASYAFGVASHQVLGRVRRPLWTLLFRSGIIEILKPGIIVILEPGITLDSLET